MVSSGTDTGDEDLLAFGTTNPARRKKPPREGLRGLPTTESDDDERRSMNHNTTIGKNNKNIITSTSNDDFTLRQVAARACKRIDIGTAVMPQFLFTADVEDGTNDSAASTEQDKLLHIFPPDSNNLDTPANKTNSTPSTSATHYARMVQRD